MNDLTQAASLQELDRRHVWHHLTQHQAFDNAPPLVMERGEGLYIWDVTGKRYLDATSGGVWCVNVGYGRQSIADAVREQLVQLNYYAGSVGTPVAARFAEALIAKMPGMSRVYFSNSGSEANEKAYKMVRQIAHRKYGGQKTKILYRERDYHGTTITCLSSTGQEERRMQYGPFTPGFVEFPHCCEYRSQFGVVDNYGELAAKAMEEVILREGPDTIGAVVLEPITAGGGVITPPVGYFKAIEAICRKYDILIHIDEVVCGLGRTGAWFAYQHYGIQPDIVTMAKGVASAYAAISCTVTTEAVFEAFRGEADDRAAYFRDISTFGGCTAGPAAALENLRIIEDEGLLENAAHMGEYLMSGLLALKDKHVLIGDVRGKGLFLGLELVTDRATREPAPERVAMRVAGACMARGLIIGRTNRSFTDYNNTLCLSPALTLNREQADEILATLDAALSEVGPAHA
ncbi:TPA: aminotransferase class III-fold pyridoxal phosphate-dependent enzyme [Pseudomonas aeruginosa]|uniref:aminotransferase family protein n=1 Tax=Pseudomonas aeruginosa TaxID=287 RepID=UPI000DF8238B|nr:aminotransferase class III-fold pyridoxal phosphate-dependent enzyme [Pseudomonas aeruginosa]MDY1450096.1 aminotransferase class III-fold pyridoxal phosphate-dependent enzyme [Pseudomonas aeruginosa]RDC79489.1 aminotransferase class III-fold pyridoxal phosphate-dependent enzyme [Pseudomonas aeruginosa]HBO2549571.1 aminotransferase class III-fold pyridoxal phosphate-dependent enzyme [Pseudomonas aeruginosa]HBO2581243.1 aminotransferase class III-fold pyridoxal phosphate-dependent enzyme [Pseu